MMVPSSSINSFETEANKNPGKSPVKTMTPPMKLGRHLEDSISRNCLDRISTLPDELLGRIISFLQTTCAVKTGILSKRWRYLFTLTTCLSFEDKPLYSYSFENERVKAARRFKEYVDNFLKNHQMSPIEKFSLVCYATYNDSDLNRWFTNALQKGVQDLYYKLGDQTGCVPNHDGFFKCETLMSLIMMGPPDHACYKIEIPLSASLPKLKILYLDHIIFFDFESIGRLFSSCGLLEKLTLKYCKCDIGGHAIHCTGILKELTVKHCSFLPGTFEIDAPNLEYLKYRSNIGVRIVPSWKNSCSFKDAKLTFDCSYSDAQEDLIKHDRELLKAAAYKATDLRLENDSVQLILTPDDDEQMPDFHCLSFLVLRDCPYLAWEYVTCLLEKSPQLCSVGFESGLHCCQCSEYYCPDHCYDSLSSSDIHLLPFSCHVKYIEVFDFCGHKCSLSLMGHLLRNASDLSELSVSICEADEVEDEVEVQLRIYRDLLRLPRASKDCRVEMMN